MSCITAKDHIVAIIYRLTAIKSQY